MSELNQNFKPICYFNQLPVILVCHTIIPSIKSSFNTSIDQIININAQLPFLINGGCSFPSIFSSFPMSSFNSQILSIDYFVRLPTSSSSAKQVHQVWPATGLSNIKSNQPLSQIIYYYHKQTIHLINAMADCHQRY